LFLEVEFCHLRAGASGLILACLLPVPGHQFQPGLFVFLFRPRLGLKLVATLDQVSNYTRQGKGSSQSGFALGPKAKKDRKNGEANDKSGIVECNWRAKVSLKSDADYLIYCQ
jgi:hypothetical protein